MEQHVKALCRYRIVRCGVFTCLFSAALRMARAELLQLPADFFSKNFSNDTDCARMEKHGII